MIRALARALLAAVVAAAPITLSAQAVPSRDAPAKSELFVGYSYFIRDYRHTQLNPVSGGMNGWNAAYARPDMFSSHVGLTADFSGIYTSGTFFSPQFYLFTAGPRFTMPLGNSTFNVHAVGGVLTATGNVIAQTSSQSIPIFGGGAAFDYPVKARLGFRFNFDYFYGGFGTNDTNQISDIVKNNFRISVGPVFHF